MEDGNCYQIHTSDGGHEADGTWTLGAPLSCDSPGGLSYTDQSERLPPSLNENLADERGEVALVGRRLFLTTGDRGLTWIDLETGEKGWDHFGLTFLTMAFGDLDADGLIDLVLAGEGLTIVYAWGTEQQAEEELIPKGTWELGRAIFEIVVADLDHDGDADLFAGLNNSSHDPEENRSAVFWNEGGRFSSEPTLAGGDSERWGMSFDAVALDLDGDGDLDLYECNDRGIDVGPNTWILNDGQGGLEAVDGAGADIRLGCMSVSFADLNQDGVLDLYLGGTRDHWSLTRLGEFWVDSSASTLEPLAIEQMVWGSAITDLDNDGIPEIIAGTGAFVGIDPTPWPLYVASRDPDGVWREGLENLEFPELTGSRAVLARDLNQDGVLDLVAGDSGHAGWLLMSDGCTANNWLEIEAPTGTVATVESKGGSQTVLITDEPGYGAWAPPSAHVGLGSDEQVDRIVLDIPWEGRVTLEGPIDTRQVVRFEPESRL